MTERSLEQITREYEQSRIDLTKGFREYLRERGITIMSPEHLAAEQANYHVAHHEQLTASEQLGVEWATAQADYGRRVLEAHELAARAHDTNARWAAAMDDRLKKGSESKP